MLYLFKSIQLALQNIRSNPLHTFLSTLGIVIGVAALVGILALGDGLEKTGREQLASTTSLNILNISSNSTKIVDGIRVPIENREVLSLDEARYLEDKFRDQALVEIIQRETAEITIGDSVYAIYLRGGTENRTKLENDSTLYGQYFTRTDVDSKTYSAVINSYLAGKISDVPTELIGVEFSLYNQSFQIVGIQETSGGEFPMIYVPISALQDLKEGYPAIIMKVNQAETIPLVEEEIKNWLDSEFDSGSELFTLASNEARIEQFTQGIKLFKLIMGAITGISVLVGGIGVMNVLLISVTERTREIGIRKATGAKKKDIIFQFMAESVTISIAGAVLGWVIGILGIFLFVPIVNSIVDAQFSAAISSGTVLIILFIAVLIGFIFGTYPAWKAAQLDPIDAIRYE